MSFNESWVPETDLPLERYRLNGMLLAGISYGMFAILTFQALIALTRKRRMTPTMSEVLRSNGLLIAYCLITFILATIGFAGNASYTQTIWIDQRNAPGGPVALIFGELNYYINRLSLACYYVMEWFMTALLLHRCFIIWNNQPVVIAGMTTLFLGTIAVSIYVLTQSVGSNFYDIKSQLAYLCMTVGTNILYTLLVVFRLLAVRKRIAEAVGHAPAKTYTSIVAMIIESAAIYSVLGVLYIASYAVGSELDNLIFLDISHVQGIAQLLIILRVANGDAFDSHVASRTAGATTTLRFTDGSRTQNAAETEDLTNYELGSSGKRAGAGGVNKSSDLVDKHDGSSAEIA